MANPRFYWYPNGSALDTIDLEPGYGALPDLCEEDDEVFGGVAHSASGRSYSVVRDRPRGFGCRRRPAQPARLRQAGRRLWVRP